MPYPEHGDTPDIEFFGDGWTPSTPLADDLIDVGRAPSAPSWLLRVTQQPVIVAAYVIVISLGVFVVAHRDGPSRTLTALGATPVASVPSSPAPPTTSPPSVSVPDMNVPPQCYQLDPAIGTATHLVPTGVWIGHNHQAVTRAKLSPLPGAQVECGPLIFPISFHTTTTGIQRALMHDLPGARLVTSTTTAHINTPGQSGVITSREVLARLHGHRIVIRVQAATAPAKPATAGRRPAGVLYRHEVISFGFRVVVQVSGRRGWRVPRAALARLARDPRLVEGR